MEKQFTASVYILENHQVLLLYHPKLKKWLPPGGHIETNELPSECAIRETLEETGLQIELIKDEHIWINQCNANSFERPWLCLLENIPPHGFQPAHQHVDFIYLGKPIGGSISEKHRAQHEIRWFSLEEALSLQPDQEIFIETQQVLQKIWGTLDLLLTSGS